MWFRLAKVVYVLVWVVGLGMSALIAYGSGEFVWFLIGAGVVAAILITVKKGFYYIALGRTSANEKPGGGFADLEDLRNDFAGVQANSPKLYQEIIAPYLDSWKAQYGRRVPLHAVKVLEQRIANEMAVVNEKKQEIIAKAASEGKTIEISSLRKQLEESIADHQGPDDEQYVSSIEHFYSRYKQNTVLRYLLMRPLIWLTN